MKRRCLIVLRQRLLYSDNKSFGALTKVKIANVQIQSPRTFSGILLEREIIFKDRNDKGDMDGDRNGEEKVQRKEAEADAFIEISGNGNDELQDSFEKIENDAKVDAELQRLMAEMNGGVASQDAE